MAAARQTTNTNALRTANWPSPRVSITSRFTLRIVPGSLSLTRSTLGSEPMVEGPELMMAKEMQRRGKGTGRGVLLDRAICWG